MRIAGKLGILIAVLVLASPGYASFCVPPKPPAKPAPPDEPCPACEPKECKKCSASPVYLSLGTYTRDETDLTLRTTGFGITVARSYDSGRLVEGPMGIGWISSLTSRLHYAVYALSGSTYQHRAVVVMPHGGIYEFTRNSSTGAFTPPVGRRDTLVQNGDGSFDMTLGNSRTVFHFNSDGTLSSMKDEFNNAINYTYDGNGRIQRVADGAGSGRFVDVTWNTATGRISSVTDSAARTIRYTYDTSGNLESVADAVTPVGEQSSKYFYAPGRFQPQLVRVEDRWNRVLTRIEWDADKVKSYTEGEYNDANPAASAGEKYRYTYSPGSPTPSTTRSHSLGNKNFTYTAATGLKTNDGTIYDSSGQVITVFDDDGRKTDYVYDASGRVVTESVYAHFNVLEVRWTYTYDPAFPDQVATRKASNPLLWSGTRFEYYPSGGAAPGALKSVYRIRTDGVTEDWDRTYEYDIRGRIISIIGGSEPSFNYTYNAAGDVLSLRRSFDPPTTFEYDNLGRVTKRIDVMGKATTYTYDAADRLLTTTLPKPTPTSSLDFTTTFTYDVYDPVSQLVFVHTTDANGRVTKQGYDALRNLGMSIDGLGNATAYAYQYNLLKSVTDANGNVITYTYDANRQLASTTFPDGAVESYVRSARGRLNSVTDRRGTKRVYTYDSFGRMVTVNNGWGGQQEISYSYQGQKLNMVVDLMAPAVRFYQFTYDDRFRVTSEGYDGETKIEYAYSGGATPHVESYTLRPPAGNSDRVTTVHYEYDNMHRVSELSFDGVVADAKIFYNDRNQYDRIEFGNGMEREYTYDDQGRLTKIDQTHPTEGTIARYTYGYDYDYAASANTMLGQRVSVTPAGESATKYKYDAAYQLVEVLPPAGNFTHWAYDAIGNRVLRTSLGSPLAYEYYKNGSNPANSSRLKRVGTSGTTLTYDENGNQSNNATWDAINRLTQHNGNAFEYDWKSRRTKRNNAKYSYFGENVARIRDTTAGVLDDLIFGPGLDEPLVRKDASGAKSYYAVDGLGSVVAVVNAAGIVTESTTYDAFGNASGTPTLGYTAREKGSGTLLYYRARYYESTTGRFISEDPLPGWFAQSHGFLAEALQPYTYAENQPTNRRDPLGLKSCGPMPAPTGLCAADAIARGEWSLCTLHNQLSLASSLDTYVLGGVLGAMVGGGLTKNLYGTCAGAAIGVVAGMMYSSNAFLAAEKVIINHTQHAVQQCTQNACIQGGNTPPKTLCSQNLQ